MKKDAFESRKSCLEIPLPQNESELKAGKQKIILGMCENYAFRRFDDERISPSFRVWE